MYPHFIRPKHKHISSKVGVWRCSSYRLKITSSISSLSKKILYLSYDLWSLPRINCVTRGQWCRVDNLRGAFFIVFLSLTTPTLFRRKINFHMLSAYEIVLGRPAEFQPTNVVNHIYTTTNIKISINFLFEEKKISINYSLKYFIKQLDHKINLQFPLCYFNS